MAARSGVRIVLDAARLPATRRRARRGARRRLDGRHAEQPRVRAGRGSATSRRSSSSSPTTRRPPAACSSRCPHEQGAGARGGVRARRALPRTRSAAPGTARGSSSVDSSSCGRRSTPLQTATTRRAPRTPSRSSTSRRARRIEPGDRLLEIGCANGQGDAAAPRAWLARSPRSSWARGPRNRHVVISPGCPSTGRSPRSTTGERGALRRRYAATAWHWIAPAVRYRKAHALLRPGGHLASRAPSRIPGSASIRSSARSRRSTRRSGSRIPASGRRRRRRSGETTRSRSRRRVSSTTFRCGATSGSTTTPPRSTSRCPTRSRATSRWSLPARAPVRRDSEAARRMRGARRHWAAILHVARPRDRHLELRRLTATVRRMDAGVQPLARVRAFALSAAAFRRLAIANVVMLIVIVATGATVRLTGSGLGCEHWPGCQAGITSEPKSYHRYIEFGNRIVAASRSSSRSSTWRRRAARASVRAGRAGSRSRSSSGTLAQAPLGAITVHYHLNPWLVLSHFLLSIVVLDARRRAGRSRRAAARARPSCPRGCARSAASSAPRCGALVVSGTLATAAGPHPGQRGRPPARHVRAGGLRARPRDRGLRHLVRVLARAGSSAARAPSSARRARRARAARRADDVGEIQYRTHLPWWLVLIHVTLAAARLGGDVAVVRSSALWRAE